VKDWDRRIVPKKTATLLATTSYPIATVVAADWGDMTLMYNSANGAYSMI
jgi:hypothetical protein